MQIYLYQSLIQWTFFGMRSEKQNNSTNNYVNLFFLTFFSSFETTTNCCELLNCVNNNEISFNEQTNERTETKIKLFIYLTITI